MIRGLVAAGSAMAMGAILDADIIGTYVVEYAVVAADFDGSDVAVNVQDLYLAADDLETDVSSVTGFRMSDSGRVNYFQSPNSTWIPSNPGGPFDTPALRQADSFVTLGGFEQGVLTPAQAPGSGENTQLSFDGGVPHPGQFFDSWANFDILGGSGLTGEVAIPDASGAPSDLGLGLLLGRFAYQGEFSIVGSEMIITWINGLGGPVSQEAFIVAPAPGAIALLAMAGFRTRPRRERG